MNSTKYLIVLCGPTGVGKTRTAVELARQLECEIISADSRQVFKEMSIGTAIPDKQELNAVTHHFIRSHSIHRYYNASLFEQEVLTFLEDYFIRKDRIIMAGGSGLYIDAVCKGIDDLPTIDRKVREKWASIYTSKGIEYLRQILMETDPEYMKQVDPNNPKRLLKALEVHEMTGRCYSSFLKHEAKKRPFSILKIGLDKQRDRLYEQINQRVDSMVAKGLIEEAKDLYPYKHLTPLKTVGYRELFASFDGEMTLNAAIERIKDHTRAYARRQLTWFRRDKDMQWFDPEETDKIIDFIKDKICT